MKRSPEWLAAYEQRRATAIGDAWKRRVAAEWNGDVEPVQLARGGETASRRPHKPELGVRLSPALPVYPVVGLCRAAGLPEPIPEYAFALPRRWRADYCWPLHKLILEIEGGLWTQGRHSRGAGAIADLAKYSEAAILGYRVIYATPDEVRNGTAMDRVMRALQPTEAAA